MKNAGDITKIRRFKEGNNLQWLEMATMANISSRHLQKVASGKMPLSKLINDKLEAISCFDGHETLIKDKRDREFKPRPVTSDESPLQYAVNEYLRRTGCSQSDIMRRSGVHVTTIWYIRTIGKTPSVTNFGRLCKACGFDAEKLLSEIIEFDDKKNGNDW